MKKKNILIYLIIVVFLLGGCKRDDNELKIAVDPTHAPHFMIDSEGKIVGDLIELLEGFFNTKGIEYSFVSYKEDQLASALLNNTIDFFISDLDFNEKDGFYQSKSIYDSSVYLMSKLEIDLKDISNSDIEVMGKSNSETNKLFKEMYLKEVNEFSVYSDMLQSFAATKGAGILIDKNTTEYLISTDSGKYFIYELVDLKSNISFSLIGKEESQDLLKEFNEYLEGDK